MGILKTHTYRCSKKVKAASTRETLLLTSYSEVSQQPFLRRLSLQLKESSFFFRSRKTSRTFQLTKGTMELAIASEELPPNKEALPSGEVTWLMSSVTSPPRLLTSRARTSIRRYLTHTTPRRSQSSSSSETVLLVVLPVLLPSASCTRSISPEPVSPLMSDPEELESLLDSSTALLR